MTLARERTKRSGSRGAPVVEDVLRATIEELGRVGYRALRIEDVAGRANVHKTTIYRRFPTKQDLVRTTIQSTFEANLTLPMTGSLRADLLHVATHAVRFSSSATGRALVRMVMTETADDDLQAILASLHDAEEAVPRQIVQGAHARGELRDGIDGELLITTLIGSLHHSMFAMSTAPSKKRIEALVDMLLYGVLAPKALDGAGTTRRRSVTGGREPAKARRRT